MTTCDASASPSIPSVKTESLRIKTLLDTVQSQSLILLLSSLFYQFFISKMFPVPFREHMTKTLNISFLPIPRGWHLGKKVPLGNTTRPSFTNLTLASNTLMDRFIFIFSKEISWLKDMQVLLTLTFVRVETAYVLFIVVLKGLANNLLHNSYSNICYIYCLIWNSV